MARAKTVAGYDCKGIPASGDKVTRWRPFAAHAEQADSAAAQVALRVSAAYSFCQRKV